MDSGLAGIIGSIAGAIIGGLISWFSAIRALEKQEKYRAKTEFTDVFVEIRRLLDRNYSKELKTTFGILDTDLEKMSKAVLKFMQSLSQPEEEKLKRLWKKLCWPDNKSELPHFEYYKVQDRNMTDEGHKDEIKRKYLALKKIKEMLEFSKAEFQPLEKNE